jgi:hypothetical protein
MAASEEGVTLQISLAPSDARHARVILPHQLRQWGSQVDRVLLSTDTKRSWGRYRSGWERGYDSLKNLTATVTSENEKVTAVQVDYSGDAQRAVAKQFLNDEVGPLRDAHGGPFYAYLFALHAVRTRYVLHADADMLFGGGSQGWIGEAIAMLKREEDVLFSGPFPGPPTEDRSLSADAAALSQGSQMFGSPFTMVNKYGGALSFKHMSTRTFLLDVERFSDRVGGIEVLSRRPGRMEKRSPGPQPLEVCFSSALANSNLRRLDILGSDPGMWYLHPPLRSERFYRELPSLVDRVERGEIPAQQRGDYDVNDSMLDWREARPRSRRRQIYWKFRRRILRPNPW